MLTFILGYVCGALSVPTGWLMWLYFSGAYQGGAAFSELDFGQLESMDQRKLQYDLNELYSQRSSMEKSLRYFASPMSGGYNELAAEALRDQIQNCDTRIRNIQAILNVGHYSPQDK